MADPATNASERLAWTMGSWRSIDLQLHVDYALNKAVDDQSKATTKMVERYIETATGQRMFEQRMTLANGQEMRSVYYADGGHCADLQRIKLPDREFDAVRIKREFSIEGAAGWHVCPEPLKYLYAGLRPLYEVLPEMQHLGEARHLGREGDLFLLAKTPSYKGPEAVFLLDRATAAPLKVKLYRTEQDRLADRPHSVWSAESLDLVEGRHLPLNSEEVIYSPAEPPEPRVVRKIIVDSVRFDRDYPASTFRPAIGPETQVTDLIANKWTPSKAPKSPARREETVAATSPPIRATPTKDWTPLLPTAASLLGLAIITIAGILWWRRRGSAPSR